MRAVHLYPCCQQQFCQPCTMPGEISLLLQNVKIVLTVWSEAFHQGRRAASSLPARPAPGQRRVAQPALTLQLRSAGDGDGQSGQEVPAASLSLPVIRRDGWFPNRGRTQEGESFSTLQRGGRGKVIGQRGQKGLKYSAAYRCPPAQASVGSGTPPVPSCSRLRTRWEQCAK